MLRLLAPAIPLLLFLGWTPLPAQATHAAPAPAAGAADGQVVFQHTCVMCHSTQPNVRIVGPSLAGVLHGPNAGHLRAVRTIILNGKDKMPAEKDKLTDQQMADLLIYLRTL